MTSSTASYFPRDGALEDFVGRLIRDDLSDDGVIPTGLAELDGFLGGGLRLGQIALVAGEAGVGTSTLALNIAAHAALRLSKPTVVVAPDSDREEILVRLVAAEAKVPVNHIRARQLRDDDRERVRRRRDLLVDAPLHLSAGHPGPTPVWSVVSQLETCLEGDSGLAVVDSTSFTEPETRLLALELKALAQRARLAVVLVTKAVPPTSRLGKPPRLVDLRDRDELADLMDVILLLHRDDVHDVESLRPGEADIEMAKHRYAPTRTTTVAFQGHYARFVDMAPP